jgi:hypothetical protein
MNHNSFRLYPGIYARLGIASGLDEKRTKLLYRAHHTHPQYLQIRFGLLIRYLIESSDMGSTYESITDVVY